MRIGLFVAVKVVHEEPLIAGGVFHPLFVVLLAVLRAKRLCEVLLWAEVRLAEEAQVQQSLAEVDIRAAAL